jgi:hypothetical protein
MRIDHRGAVLAVAASGTIAVFVSGCGAVKRTTSTVVSSSQSPAAQAFKYAECMRAHGLSGFPDPVVNTQGNSTRIAMMAPKSVMSAPGAKQALAACSSILPAPPNAAQMAQQQHRRELGMLAFARCIRGRGVKDFPDPTAQGNLTLEMITAAGVDLQAPNVIAAARACVSSSDGLITGADVARATQGGG